MHSIDINLNPLLVEVNKAIELAITPIATPAIKSVNLSITAKKKTWRRR